MSLIRTLFFRLSVSHTVSVHDLKQGLGASSAPGAKKTATSRYKLKASITLFNKNLAIT